MVKTRAWAARAAGSPKRAIARFSSWLSEKRRWSEPFGKLRRSCSQVPRISEAGAPSERTRLRVAWKGQA